MIYIILVLLMIFVSILTLIYFIFEGRNYNKRINLIPLSMYRVIENFYSIQKTDERVYLFDFRKDDILFVISQLGKNTISYKVLINDQIIEIKPYQYIRDSVYTEEKYWKNFSLCLERIDKK